MMKASANNPNDDDSTPATEEVVPVAVAVAPWEDDDDHNETAEAAVDEAATLQQQPQQHKIVPSMKKQRSSSNEKKKEVETEKVISIQIVSAFYRPCEQKQQQQQLGNSGGGDGGAAESASLHSSTMSKLYTRDVTPFVRALLMAQGKQRQQEEEEAETSEIAVENKEQRRQPENAIISNENQKCKTAIINSSSSNSIAPIPINAVTANGMKRSKICILDDMLQQQSMNSIFGDPCPGTSKRLFISYRVLNKHNIDNEQEQQQQQGQEHDGKKKKTFGECSSTAAPIIHYVSFAEHEKVILNLMSRSKTCQPQADGNEEEGSNDEDAHDSMDSDHSSVVDDAFQPRKQSSVALNSAASTPPHENENVPWRLRATSSETILPLVLPYLQIKERVACRLVCQVWKNIIRDWGVATTIDVQDSTGTAMYSCSASSNTNNDHNSNVSSFFSNNYYSRPFIRGILKHSYSALHTLFLSGLQDLNGPCDLHPSIPHLRKLKCLDVSHCIQLGDDTLTLLAQHCCTTLQVLYIKALPLVTDVGVMAICRACRELQVLDISHLHALTDQTGMAIGQHLHKLRALYMRDNYNITNSSIDLITTRTGAAGGGGSAVMLETLTLWGCMRLKHLNFGTTDPTLSPTTLATGGCNNGYSTTVSSGAKLVTLNLWGCHSLTDDWASALSGMHNLKSLVVSECHRLTDAFVLALAQTVPQLHHLFLRYCKRLTDNAVDAIALNMPNLYSLDLSFCSRLSAAAIVRLLDLHWRTLAELRLQSCNLEISNMDQDTGRLHCKSNAGRQILHSLRRHGGGVDGSGGCCLSVLDVRPSLVGSHDGVLADDDPFVKGMKALSFAQTVPCCFVRPARWNPQVEQVLSN